MSIAVVASEIQRFLQSTEPEVLCISGNWGVGKTYAWQKHVSEADRDGKLTVGRYAYVSLFGLNTLDDLHKSVVENTVIAKGNLTSPDAGTFKDGLKGGERLLRQSRPLLEHAANFLGYKEAAETLYRAAFLSVRGQLICFDDLERAGKGLEMRDILGLASMLKEQKKLQNSVAHECRGNGGERKGRFR